MTRTRLFAALLAASSCGDDGASAPAAETGSSGAAPPLTSTTGPQGSSGSASSGSSESSSSGMPPVEPEVDWPHLACDPLVPGLCGFPFPNNVFTVADAATTTGRRVQFDPETAPVNHNGVAAQTFPFEHSDGFSPSAAILTHLAGATAQGLPSPLSLGASVEADSPTILMDAESGEWTPHFAEVDVNAPTDATRTFFIRPVVPLQPGRRYIVAIRNVVDSSGAPLPAESAFGALRDGVLSGDPDVDDRRGLYEDIFSRLQDTGNVSRDELQLAWDFTTASDENVTGWMLAMRDDALEIVGDAGPTYTIDDVQPDPSPELMLRIEGTMSVPLYLDDPGAGGGLVLGDDGMPEQNGFADYPFFVLVPQSAATEPAGVIHIGHGLLGERFQAEADYYRAFANDNGYVLVATDWIGMANDDVANIIDLIGTGELERFHTITDRMHQGVLNAVLSIRLMIGAFMDDPLMDMGTHNAIDPSRVHYIGSSQGGILGAVLMAVSPDIERGVLDVPGQPYNLLLERSADFVPFLNILRTSYPNAMDIHLVLCLAQMLWDRAEPAGYAKFIHNEPLPGSPAKDVLLQVAIGDHQVSTLGAHIMARSIGAPNLAPANREVWGLETARGMAQGAGMIEYDYGLPPEPIVNVPMSEGDDPHGQVRRNAASIQTRAQFLATGVIETFCDGPCDPL